MLHEWDFLLLFVQHHNNNNNNTTKVVMIVRLVVSTAVYRLCKKKYTFHTQNRSRANLNSSMHFAWVYIHNIMKILVIIILSNEPCLPAAHTHSEIILQSYGHLPDIYHIIVILLLSMLYYCCTCVLLGNVFETNAFAG